MEVLVFGGTVEGRRLVEWLDARGTCKVVACAVTDYGVSLLEGSERVTVMQGPLSASEKDQIFQEHNICCIVDATHPFAQHITESIRELGNAHGVDVVRVVREEVPDGPWISVDNAREAAEYLAKTQGNILLTTGTKDVMTYVQAIDDYQERLFVRVLPVVDALTKMTKAGIPTSHVLAMQGPFSCELNEALIRQLNISWLVTKQSGPSGGFGEKVAAAQATGTQLVVINRPKEEGFSLAETQTLLEERYGI